MGAFRARPVRVPCPSCGELPRSLRFVFPSFSPLFHQLKIGPLVRLEPTLIELEREREDLLIIGHASVIRCILAYLIGLPASEIPAIEVARGDLIEVVPTSYGVHSQAFHFWDGPGRSDGGTGKDEANFYENYAEDTKGKRRPEVEGAA